MYAPGEKLRSLEKLLQILLKQTVLTLLFIFCFFCPKHQKPKYIFFSLIEEQALSNTQGRSLIDFLNEDRFGFEASEKNTLIEIRKIKYVWWKKNFYATYDVALYLLFRCVDKKKLAKLYFEISKETFQSSRYSFSILEWKVNVFDLKLWQEFIRGLSSDLYLLTTQSSEFKLPSAFFLPAHSNVKKIMFWYGTNTEALGIKQLHSKQHSNASQLNQYIDIHYVWDNYQNNLLKNKGLINLEVKGSITFIPRKSKKLVCQSPSLIYFDVTPQTKANSAYTVDFCKSNLVGIVSVCNEISKEYKLRIDLLVKPKRRYRKLDSQTYIRFLEKLKDDKKIVILNENSNIYSLISSTNLTLGIAFTSPVLIAKELNVPGFFLGLDGPRFPDMYNEVKVLTNTLDLKETILSALNLDL